MTTSESASIRILIVDDHEVVRRGVRSLLTESNYDVCGEAVDGREAVEKARQLKPDIVVMDISMPGMNGLEATRLIRTILTDTEVVVMSQHEVPAMVREAFRAGARGYVVKSSMARDLIAALNTVSRHESFFDPAIPITTDRSSHIDAQEILQRSAALERALRESEELYRTTFDLAAVGIAHVDPQGQWMRVNQQLCKILGYSEEELLKLKFQDITHPEDLESDLIQTEKVRTGELKTFSMEKRYIRKDGAAVWANLTVSGVRNDNGELKHFISVVEEIDARREAEEARFRLAAIVASSDDAIVSKDLNGIIKSWNRGAERIFGYTPEEVIGRPITILIPQELQDEEKHILRRIRKGERVEPFETIRITKSGERLNISLTISPIKDAQGRIIGASKIARDVTQQKRAEQAQRVSEARLELALEASKAGLFEWDIVNRRGKWNEQLAAIYGFVPAAEEITYQEWRGLFHPDDVDRLVREAEEAYRTQDDFQFEFRTVLPDHSLRWISSRGRIARDASGNPLQMIGIHADITRQKEAEAALHREEQQFRVLADSIPELCWMAHPDGGLFWYNQRWYDYTGKTLEQMKGWGWQSVHDPEVLPEVLQKWKESIATGQPFEMVFPLRGGDGSFRPFLTRIRPLKDENGRVLRFGTNTDIASQWQVEEALRDSEARLRAVFSQTYSFLVLLTTDGTILDANRAALEAAGCEREQVIGRKLWEPWWAALPDEVYLLQNSIAKAAGGESVREECYFCLADGSRRFAHRTLNPIVDEHGHVLMIVATGLDMTEHKELQDKLEARVRQRTSELEEKNLALLEQSETVRQLSARLLQTQDEERRRIARELHDSSGQLIAALQMTLIPLELEAKNMPGDFAKGIGQSLGFLEQLSKELRTVSYLLHPPLLDEAGLPSAIRWYVEGFAERSKVEVRLELAEDLGRLPHEMEMNVFRIVQEGLTNIHRHSGSKQAEIRLTRSSDEVCLEIQDYGTGMSASKNGKRKTGRTGVGIQGMKERARQLNGGVEIHSNAKGTIVKVNLPIPPATPATAYAGSSQTRSA